jgi:predicted acylesterase/phospholipase RssA
VSGPPRARLKQDLPFRRPALVLSGGGALGAYEVGVLKVLEVIGLVPSLVVGVSIGAINAVAWLAAGRDARPIEGVWLTARGEALGVQWVSLAIRVSGALTTVVASLEAALTLAGSRELSGARWLWHRPSAQSDLLSTQLDLALWIVVALTGALMVVYARRVASGLDRRANSVDPARARRWLTRATWIALGLYVVVWWTPVSWPQRVSAAIVILLALAWAASTPGRFGGWLRSLALGLMPETRGRGLWSGRARRRLLEQLVVAGDRTRICGSGTALVVSALSVDRGSVAQFVSWPEPDSAFEERIASELGEVIHVRDADEMISAAVASSAIPGIFQPERVAGRDFVDAGGFANQPLHVAIAHGSDAVLAVLLAPTEPPGDRPPPADVVALGGRLLELANWRALQAELRHLPTDWSRDRTPARVCVIEPRAPLPASPLTFDPERAAELIALGERDAWAALARAGWLDSAPAEPPAASGA